MIQIEPERKRDNRIKCDFCLADEAMGSGKPERKEVEIEGTIWDTWWVPVDEHIYLHYAIDIADIRRTQKYLEKANNEIKTLKWMIPICSSCKKIRDDEEYWSKIESYIESHPDAQFSHGLCEKCMEKLYGNKN